MAERSTSYWRTEVNPFGGDVTIEVFVSGQDLLRWHGDRLALLYRAGRLIEEAFTDPLAETSGGRLKRGLRRMEREGEAP